MQTHWKKTFLALPLAGLLVTSLGACAHERLHRDLGVLHEDFHAQPHTSAEHRRLHEDLRDLHEAEHERGYDGDRFYDRDSYNGGGRYYGSGY